jgi:hypothetical protein
MADCDRGNSGPLIARRGRAGPMHPDRSAIHAGIGGDRATARSACGSALLREARGQARGSRCRVVERLLGSERHCLQGIIRLAHKQGEIADGSDQPDAYERNREAKPSQHRRSITDVAELRMQIAR